MTAPEAVGADRRPELRDWLALAVRSVGPGLSVMSAVPVLMTQWHSARSLPGRRIDCAPEAGALGAQR